MKSNDDNYAQILDVQVNGRCNYDCKNCHRFFECNSRFKMHILSQGRMGQIQENLSRIDSILVIMGGKGGVGKSTVSSQLAMSLALQGYRVGIVDCDFHGPSIPKLLGVHENERLVAGEEGIIPVEAAWGIKVVSPHFLVGKKESLTWFDRLKREALEGFLAHVCYGDLDFLVIDMPPGTGSETVNLFKYVPSEKAGVLIVSTPSELAQGVARRCISLCKKIPMRILGIIENMSGFRCPQCGYESGVFTTGGAIRLAEEENIPFLGRIPLDINLRRAADKGESVVAAHPGSASSKSFLDLVNKITTVCKARGADRPGELKRAAELPQESMPYILEMNMEFGCGETRCDDCSRYFSCPFPEKRERFEGVRHEKVEKRMSLIKKKIAIVSGKGGVGKSTISANLALCLAREGHRVGLVDLDFHGPSVPRLLGLQGKRMRKFADGIEPVEGPLGMKVVSMGFVLKEDEAITWFHESKRGALGDFLAEVKYGELDYLILDLPPGTGSENYNLLRELPQLDGVITVTIPSLLSREVVMRALSLFYKARVPILGLIVNMSGFICPQCKTLTPVFSEEKGDNFAAELDITVLGELPLDETIAGGSDNGKPFVLEHPNSPVSLRMMRIAESLT